MAGEFAETTLSRLLSFANGRSSPKRADGLPYPVYGSNGVIGYAIEANAEEGSIIIGRVGSYCGSLYISTQRCWVTDNAIRATALGDNDSRFLFYLVSTLNLNNWRAGSGQPLLNQDILSRIPASAPEPAEQRAIAYILGTLDDRIELNRRMNETLEAIARALFKSWFVDFDPVRAKAEGRDPGLPKPLAELFPNSFEDSELGEIPKGWRVGVLDELAGLVLGGDWGADGPTPENSMPARSIRGADIPDIQAGGIGKMPIRYLRPSSLEKRRLFDGDLVVEISGGSPIQSTGRPVLVSEGLIKRLDTPLVCSNFCRMLRPKERTCSKFIYLWLRELYASDVFLQFETGTTGIKNFAFTIFCSTFKLCIPPMAVLTAFDESVSVLFTKQQSNAAEGGTLAAIRDTLLPNLILGKLRLKGAAKGSGSGV